MPQPSRKIVSQSFNITYLKNKHIDLQAFICVNSLPDCEAQSVTCLATDVCLTADPGVASYTELLKKPDTFYLL